MKTKVFTQQQLEDFVNDKKVVTAEPVKEGEVTEKELPHQEFHSEGIYKNEKKGITVVIMLGEVVQALNEKGEKLVCCEKCGRFYSKGKEPDVFETRCEDLGDYPLPPISLSGRRAGYCIYLPLVVRLEKIEKKIIVSVWKHSFDTDLENPDKRNYSRYTHLKNVDFKPKINQKVWLKTWRNDK